jgi:hypothetical protein
MPECYVPGDTRTKELTTMGGSQSPQDDRLETGAGAAVPPTLDIKSFNADAARAGKPWRLVASGDHGFVLVEGTGGREILDLRATRTEFEAIRRASLYLSKELSGGS